MSTNKKTEVLRHAFEEIKSRPKKDDQSSKLQRVKSEMAAQNKQRIKEKDRREEAERASKRFKQELSELVQKNETLQAENKVRKWLPVCIFWLAVATVFAYFVILILSGIEANGFKLQSVELSSIGVSAVGGSLALLGFILQGLFKSRGNEQKKKKK